MRQPTNSIDSAVLDQSSPVQCGQTGSGLIEIGASNAADMQDFRTWWKAHVKETRYWGGGPDGAWSSAAANAG